MFFPFLEPQMTQRSERNPARRFRQNETEKSDWDGVKRYIQGKSSLTSVVSHSPEYNTLHGRKKAPSYLEAGLDLATYNTPTSLRVL